jgi:dihydroneopterin aldolase
MKNNITSEILIEGMEFFAYHGFYPEENRIGCKYTIDLRLTLPLDEPGTTDNLIHTINYEEVFILVRREMEIESKLIEHVAQRIMSALWAKYPQLQHIDLNLYKYNPPLGGQVHRVGIHLYE